MKDSINLFKEKCINEIEENIIQTVDQYLEAPESMAELVIKVKNAVNRLGCILVENILNSLDHGLRTSRERKQEWNIKVTESRKLLTSMGEIRFSHTLFCDKTGGESVYLLDELIGIGKDPRMTEDAEALVYLNGAADPYQRTGRMIAEGAEVSAQTVMNKVHSLRFSY